MALLFVFIVGTARAQVPDVVGHPAQESRSDHRPFNHLMAGGVAGQYGLVGGSLTWMFGESPFGLAAGAGPFGSSAWFTVALFDSRNGHSALLSGPSEFFVNVGAITAFKDGNNWFQIGLGERRFLDPQQHTFIELGLDFSSPITAGAPRGFRGYGPVFPHLAIGYTFR